MAPAAAAASRTVETDYVGIPTTAGTAWSLGAGPAAAGGSGFQPILPGETTVDVTVSDIDGKDTFNVVAFWVGDDFVRGHGFCNSIEDVPIMPGATYLQVYVQTDDWSDEHDWGFDCGADELSQAGTVTVTFE